MITNNKQLIATHIDLAWNRGKYEQVREYLSDNFYYKTTFTDEILNTNQYLAVISVMRDAMPDLTVEIELIMAEDDNVMTQVSFFGEVQKPFYGVPVSKNIISFQAMSVWQVENNRIVSADTLIDMTGVSRQVGSAIAPQIPLEIRNASLLNVDKRA